MGIKSIEEYIAKHGPEKGPKLHKKMVERERKNALAPYKRLSKDWFIWKYGETEGLERFKSHVSKSLQSLENFVSRYGVEEGTKKYQETISKKNTVKLAKEKYGEDYVEDWYKRAGESNKKSRSNFSSEKKAAIKAKSAETRKRKNPHGKTRRELFNEKYGDDGPRLYGEYLQSLFKGIGISKEATSLIEDLINSNPWLRYHEIYYRTPEGGKEYFLSDKDGISFYDFVVLDAKVILEYDGAKWHPTPEEVELYGDDIMEVTGISYKEAFSRDLAKLERAKKNGFEVFKIRSDFTTEQKRVIISSFIERIQNGKTGNL